MAVGKHRNAQDGEAIPSETERGGSSGEPQLRVLGVVETDGHLRAGRPGEPPQGHEQVLVRAPLGDLLTSGLLDRRADDCNGGNGEGRGGDVELVELLVPPNSLLSGQTLVAGGLPARLGLVPFAVAWRRDLRPAPLQDLVLREGDVILATLRGDRPPPRGAFARRATYWSWASWSTVYAPPPTRTTLSVVLVGAALGLVAFALPLTVAFSQRILIVTSNRRPGAAHLGPHLGVLNELKVDVPS